MYEVNRVPGELLGRERRRKGKVSFLKYFNLQVVNKILTNGQEKLAYLDRLESKLQLEENGKKKKREENGKPFQFLFSIFNASEELSFNQRSLKCV